MVNQQVLLLNVKLGQSVCERLVVVVVLKDLRLEDSRVFSGNQMGRVGKRSSHLCSQKISDYGCESNQRIVDDDHFHKIKG
jgi:hypothetical protein